MSSTDGDRGKLRPVFRLVDLASLSMSSVAPIFSVAAAGGAMVSAAGRAVPLAVVLVALPFLVCSWIFLSLNQHFPHAGASYHWARRIVHVQYSHLQAWVLLMAYFWSLPPILIPAARFTLAAWGIAHPGAGLQIGVALAWATLAGAVLLRGAQMTARVTQAFLGIELASVLTMAVVGYGRWSRFHAGLSQLALGHARWPGVIVCMVIAATIVDGWEIDSYAAEEARRPRVTPGWGGVVGATAVVAYYLLIWPILLHEVPMASLAASDDVLTTWSRTAAPALLPVIRVAVIASTAGSLWLTTFILSRALFAMARDGILPVGLGRLTGRRVPGWAVVLPIASAMAVVSLEWVLPSVRAWFSVVLGAAGFFLVAEFWLDGVNMVVFLTRHHRRLRHGLNPHHHRLLWVGAIFVVLSLGALEALFFRYGPRYLGAGIDWVTVGMIGLGGVYVFSLWRRGRPARTVIAVGDPWEEEKVQEGGGPK